VTGYWNFSGQPSFFINITSIQRIQKTEDRNQKSEYRIQKNPNSELGTPNPKHRTPARREALPTQGSRRRHTVERRSGWFAGGRPLRRRRGMELTSFIGGCKGPPSEKTEDRIQKDPNSELRTPNLEPRTRNPWLALPTQGPRRKNTKLYGQIEFGCALVFFVYFRELCPQPNTPTLKHW